MVGEGKRNGRPVDAAETCKKRAEWRRLPRKNLHILGLLKRKRQLQFQESFFIFAFAHRHKNYRNNIKKKTLLAIAREHRGIFQLSNLNNP